MGGEYDEFADFFTCTILLVLIRKTFLHTNSICGVYMFTLVTLTRARSVTPGTHVVTKLTRIYLGRFQFTSTF